MEAKKQSRAEAVKESTNEEVMKNRKRKTFQREESELTLTRNVKFSRVNMIDLADLKRIFVEALEIIFVYQNHKKENFGPRTFIHLMDQIIPTAFIYNTAYWIFYEPTELGPIALCCCARYGCACLHRFDSRFDAWLGDCKLEEESTFVPRLEGTIFPRDVSLEINVTADYIDISLDFSVACKNSGGSSIYCFVNLVSRYKLMWEVNKCVTRTFLMFEPSSVVHKMYGSLLDDVLLKMCHYYYERIMVNLDSSFYTLRRVHTYPAIIYYIDVPFNV